MDLSKEEIKRLIETDRPPFAFQRPVILDIGCYDGSDSLELAQLFKGECEIHCFEADRRSRELFVAVNETEPFNRSLHLWPVAIGAEDWKKIVLHKSDSATRRHYDDQKSWSASSSIRKPKTHLEIFPDVSFNESEEVDVCTLDMWAWFHDFNIIDFIWCDVNGAEGDVVKGAKDVLKMTRYLYIEFSDKELYEGQISKKELLSLLPDFEEIAVFNFELGNFGNVLLKNRNL